VCLWDVALRIYFFYFNLFCLILSCSIFSLEVGRCEIETRRGTFFGERVGMGKMVLYMRGVLESPKPLFDVYCWGADS